MIKDSVTRGSDHKIDWSIWMHSILSYLVPQLFFLHYLFHYTFNEFYLSWLRLDFLVGTRQIHISKCCLRWDHGGWAIHLTLGISSVFNHWHWFLRSDLHIFRLGFWLGFCCWWHWKTNIKVIFINYELFLRFLSTVIRYKILLEISVLRSQGR